MHVNLEFFKNKTRKTNTATTKRCGMSWSRPKHCGPSDCFSQLQRTLLLECWPCNSLLDGGNPDVYGRLREVKQNGWAPKREFIFQAKWFRGERLVSINNLFYIQACKVLGDGFTFIKSRGPLSGCCLLNLHLPKRRSPQTRSPFLPSHWRWTQVDGRNPAHQLDNR